MLVHKACGWWKRNMRDFQGWVLHLFWQKNVLDDVALLLFGKLDHSILGAPKIISYPPPFWGTCQTCISWNASPATVNNPGGEWWHSTWRIIPWLVYKSPKKGCGTPSTWPSFMAWKWGWNPNDPYIHWDDPPSRGEARIRACSFGQPRLSASSWNPRSDAESEDGEASRKKKQLCLKKGDATRKKTTNKRTIDVCINHWNNERTKSLSKIMLNYVICAWPPEKKPPSNRSSSSEWLENELNKHTVPKWWWNPTNHQARKTRAFRVCPRSHSLHWIHRRLRGLRHCLSAFGI